MSTAAEYAYFLYDIEKAQAYNTGEIHNASEVGVRALDDFTLEVRLNRPLAYFPSIVTFMVTFPLKMKRSNIRGTCKIPRHKLLSQVFQGLFC